MDQPDLNPDPNSKQNSSQWYKGWMLIRLALVLVLVVWLGEKYLLPAITHSDGGIMRKVVSGIGFTIVALMLLAFIGLVVWLVIRWRKSRPNDPSRVTAPKRKMSTGWKVIIWLFALWALCYFVVPRIVMYFYLRSPEGKYALAHPQSKPGQRLQTPVGYRMGFCDLSHTHLGDYRKDDPPQIKISNLQGGGYCIHLLMPRNRHWETFFAEKGQLPGNYGSIWCTGQPLPGPIRYEDNPYFGPVTGQGDFRNCPYDFYLQGNGEAKFTPTGPPS